MTPEGTYREMLFRSLNEAYAMPGDPLALPDGIQEPEPEPQFPTDPSTWTEEMMGKAAENALIGLTCATCDKKRNCLFAVANDWKTCPHYQPKILRTVIIEYLEKAILDVEGLG